MRTYLTIFLTVLVLASCNTGSGKRTLKDSDRIDAPEIVADQAGEIETQYENGEISLSTYKLEMAELLDEAERLRLKSENLEDASYFPAWARELGLKEPENMKVDPEYSHMTSFDNAREMFNSITLVYNGDYETAMKEAEKIAEGAGVPVSTTWEKNFEMSKKLGNPELKGKVFMNYDFGMDQDIDYLITIEVDESGRLTISAADARQMNNIIKQHTLNPDN